MELDRQLPRFHNSRVLRNLVRKYAGSFPYRRWDAWFDNQPTWDNWPNGPGNPFDNRPTWDNWDNRGR